MVTPSACAAEHNLMQRLQHEPESRTQRSCSIAHNTSSSSNTTSDISDIRNISNTASCFGFRRLSLAQLSLLGVLLIITIAASSWPTGTSAAPRVARGAHLIWPHPNSSTEPAPSTPKAPAPAAAKAAHPHRRRLKARRHHHVLVREAAKEAEVLIMNQTEGLTKCKAMEVTAKGLAAELEKALKKAQTYKDSVICVTEDWLQHFYNNATIQNETKAFLYHQLELEHPLQERLKNVTYDGKKFEYEGPVGSLAEEMPKIIETLLVLEALIKSVTYDKGHYTCTFRHLKDAVQSNTASAMELMKEQQCNAPKEIHYKSNLVRLPFFIAMETIKVLTVLEYTYEKLLNA